VKDETPKLQSPRHKAIVVVLLALVVTLFVGSLCVNPSTANDLFWQLRTGREIVNSHHFPHHDTYSWTRYGTPWVVHEWLTFVLFWGAFHLAGFTGIWLLTVLLAITAFLIFFMVTLRETNGAPLTAFLLTLFVSIVCAPFFQPRPQLFTYLFIIVIVCLVLSERRNPERKNMLWGLVPLFALWANLHAGVLIGIGILFAFGVGDLIQAYVERTDEAERARLLKNAKYLCVVGVTGIGATLINPYSWHIYQNFHATISNSTAMNIVQEWTPLDFHGPFGQLFEGFAAITLFALVCSKEKKDVAEILLVVALTHEALTANRNVPLFGIIIGLLIARHLQSSISSLLGMGENKGQPEQVTLFGPTPSIGMVAIVGVAIALFGCVRADGILKDNASPKGSLLVRCASASVSLRSFPDAACRFIRAEHFPISTRFYNIYADGGYLIWALPEHRVFIDGRADVYFGDILEQFHQMGALPYNWRTILGRHKCDAVLTSSSEAQARLFLCAPDWALVYTDRSDLDLSEAKSQGRSCFLIFLKRTPENAALISQCRHDCRILNDPGFFRRYHNYQSLN
jgi:hypothetical protein